MPTVSEALAEAARRDPELASYYEFHRKLFELQEKARQDISATLEMADKEALRILMLQGLPLIGFAQLPLEPGRFAGLAVTLAEALASYYPELQGQALPATPADWTALAEKRFVENQAGRARSVPSLSPTGDPAGKGGFAQTLVQQEFGEVSDRLAETAADLALRPYLAWGAEQVLPHVDQAVWKQGYCPVCGGVPDFALLEEETGARRLMCARCDTQWRYSRVGCPFCETRDYSQIVYYPSDDEVYRLYVCQACQRYLKTLDLRKARPPVILPVERITSVALDLAAREQGYR